MRSAYFPYAPTVSRRPAARTFLLPLIAIFVHTAIQALVSMGYFLVYRLSSYFANGMSALETFNLSDLVAPLGFSALVQILLYSLVLLVLTRKEPFYAGLAPRRPAHLPLTVLISLGALSAAQLIVTAIGFLGSRLPVFEDLLNEYVTHSAATVSQNLFLNFIVIAVLVPLAEELLFRGILVGELRRVAGDGFAIFFGGLIFALVHVNPLQIIYVLPAGLLFSAVYVYTDSLVLVVLMHILYNFFGSIFPTLFDLEDVLQKSPGLAMLFGCLLVLLLLLGATAFIILRRGHKKGRREALAQLAAAQGRQGAQAVSVTVS